MNKIELYYNNHVNDEDKRLEYNIFEMPLTISYIEKYLQPPAKILDIACGTGRYAEKLLEKNYQLGLNDISHENISLTQKRIKGYKGVLHIDNEDAMISDIWHKEKWDAILILGPLYHITKKKKGKNC